MKASVVGLNGKSSGEVDVPEVFETQLRPDLVKRVFWLVDSHRLQPKGRDPMAGERTSAETHSPPTGTGRSRIPRVKGERYPRGGLAGGVASVVKGRLAHPPRSEKVIHLGVNRKERRLATESAIAYTADLDAVQARGHRVKKLALPLVVADDIETVEKTSELGLVPGEGTAEGRARKGRGADKAQHREAQAEREGLQDGRRAADCGHQRQGRGKGGRRDPRGGRHEGRELERGGPGARRSAR